MAEQLRQAASRLVRIKEVTARVGWGKAMIYRAIREKRFPANVRLGPNSVAWNEADIDRWIAARIADSAKGA